MTSHEIARRLLEMPDVPLLINGWGSDEGLGPFRVSLLDLHDDEAAISLDYDSDEDCACDDGAPEGTPLICRPVAAGDVCTMTHAQIQPISPESLATWTDPFGTNR